MTVLPHGFTIRLRDSLVRADHGRVLVGGSPARVLRLSEAARQALASGILTVTGAGSAALARRLLDGNLADPVLAASPGAEEAEITVVVPVRDRPDELDRCLRALAGLPVIVVDDASRHPEAVAAVVSRHGARLIALATNVGPAGARNAGLAEVTTECVAFVDSDLTVTPNSLHALARHVADPTVALVAPRVVGRARPRDLTPPSPEPPPVEVQGTPTPSPETNTPAATPSTTRTPEPPPVEVRGAPAPSRETNTSAGTLTSPPARRLRWFERYDEAASSLDVGRTGGLVRPGSTVGWVPSACLVGRTAVLREFSFDADWRVGEDVDLVWRLLAAGHQVRYDPSVRAEHEVRGTLRGWLGRKFLYGTSGAALAERHGQHVAPAVLSIPMALGAAALLQRRWWSIPVAAAAVAVTAAPMRTALPLEQDATAVAGRVALRGLGWAVRQESGLLLRHWWPVTAVLAPFSRTVRRAALTALVVDAVTFHHERGGVPLHVSVPARRLDDLAYGAGLWAGAGRARDLSALAVRLTRRPRQARQAPTVGS